MQNTLALHGRFAACFLLAGVVGCTEASSDSSSGNGAPEATAATFSLAEDGVLGGRLAARDPDGDELTLAIVAPPRSGALTVEGDRFTYRPHPNFHGEDFLTFTASDGEDTSAAARVTFRVAPIDDAPQLGANVFTGPAGFRITGRISALDPDGAPLTYAVPSPISGTFIELDSATGHFVYEPHPYLAGAELVPIAVVGDGVSTTGTLTLNLERVSFAGTWRATEVRLDDAPCAGFSLPIEATASGVTLLAHDVTCGDETTTYEPLQLHLDTDSPSTLRASKDLLIAPGSVLHLAISLEPIPAKPNTYRYTETFSGAFEQVMTATLTRA